MMPIHWVPFLEAYPARLLSRRGIVQLRPCLRSSSCFLHSFLQPRFGDFAGGTLSYIAESGSVGDYINSISSLSTRKILEIYPGHGDISTSPEEDMEKAVFNAKAFLQSEDAVKVARFKEADTAGAGGGERV